MDLILDVINTITNFLWGYVILILLTLVGIFFTLKGKFMQITLFKKLGYQLKNSNMNISSKQSRRTQRF